MRRDASISSIRADFYCMLFGLPLLTLLALPFIVIWGLTRFWEGWTYIFSHLPEFLLILIAGTLAHELLHGFIWALAGHQPLERIRFGMQWNTLTPFAHCKVPLAVKAFRLGKLIPGLVLGVVPVFAATITGWEKVLAYGMIFTFSAFGDFLTIWLLRGIASDNWVIDHPHRPGCIIID